MCSIFLIFYLAVDVLTMFCAQRSMVLIFATYVNLKPSSTVKVMKCTPIFSHRHTHSRTVILQEPEHCSHCSAIAFFMDIQVNHSFALIHSCISMTHQGLFYYLFYYSVDLHCEIFGFTKFVLFFSFHNFLFSLYKS